MGSPARYAFGGAAKPGTNGWFASPIEVFVSGSYVCTGINVTAPLGAALGAGYEVKIFGHYTSGPYSGTFTVVAPETQPTTSGTKYLIFPNGGQISFTAGAVATASTPTASCTVQAGAPLMVQMVWNTTTLRPDYVVTMKDQMQMTFSLERVNSSAKTLMYHIVKQADRVGNSISFTYTDVVSPNPMADGSTGPANGYGTPFQLLAGINDSAGTSLLSLSRNLTYSNGASANSMGVILSISDRYSRSVYYQTTWCANANVPSGFAQGYAMLTQVSQIVATGTSSPPFRFQHTYTSETNGEGTETIGSFLTTITVPSPTGSGTSTSTIAYQSSTSFVSSVTDGNGNVRTYQPVNSSGVPITSGYTSSNGTLVTVKNATGTIIYSYIGRYDGNMSKTTTTDGAGNVIESRVYSSPDNPYRASSVSDGDGYTWQNCTDGVQAFS